MKAFAQTAQEAQTLVMLRALANPARFRIVQLLASRDECVYGDLADELPLAQSSISFHLKVLTDAGIVHGTLDGPNRCYCLNPDALSLLRILFTVWEQRGHRA